MAAGMKIGPHPAEPAAQGEQPVECPVSPLGCLQIPRCPGECERAAMHDHATASDRLAPHDPDDGPLTFWRVVGILVLGFGTAGAIDRWVEREEAPRIVSREARCGYLVLYGNNGRPVYVEQRPEPEICVYLAAHRGY